MVPTVCGLVENCERFGDDAAETVAMIGMGVCSVATIEGAVLRERTPPRRETQLAAH